MQKIKIEVDEQHDAMRAVGGPYSVCLLVWKAISLFEWT